MRTKCKQHGVYVNVSYGCPCVDGFDEHDDPCECGCPVCASLSGMSAEVEQLRKWRDAKAFVVKGGELRIASGDIGHIVVKDGGTVSIGDKAGTIDTMTVLPGGSVGSALSGVTAEVVELRVAERAVRWPVGQPWDGDKSKWHTPASLERGAFIVIPKEIDDDA